MTKHPMQPVIQDERGDYCFKTNVIVRFLLDRGRFDMNDLAAMPFADEDRVQFAQLIGYSVSGFGELRYVSVEEYRQAERQIPSNQDGEKTLKDLRNEWLDAESDSIVAGAKASEFSNRYAKAVAKEAGFEQGDIYDGEYMIDSFRPLIGGAVNVVLIKMDDSQRVWVTLDEMKKAMEGHEQHSDE